MKQTKSTIGMLNHRYRLLLRKFAYLNRMIILSFEACCLSLGTFGFAMAETYVNTGNVTIEGNTVNEWEKEDGTPVSNDSIVSKSGNVSEFLGGNIYDGSKNQGPLIKGEAGETVAVSSHNGEEIIFRNWNHGPGQLENDLGGVLHGNQVVIGDNVRFLDNHNQTSASAIFSSDGIVIGNNVEFSNNSSAGNTTYWFGTQPEGGTIHSDTGTITVGDNFKMSNNKGATNGGLFMGKGDIIIGNNAKFTDNATINTTMNASYGGAIQSYLGSVTLGDDAFLSGNTAEVRGGAIYADSNVVFGNNAVLTNNSTGMDRLSESTLDKTGGAIFTMGTLTFGDNATLSENRSLDNGGAIYAHKDTLFGDGASISGNHAGKTGGAIYTKGNLVFGNDANVTFNSSDSFAGAIYTRLDLSFGNNATIKGNHSTSQGGAIVIEETGNLTFGENAILRDNEAGNSSSRQSGGAIFDQNSNGYITFGNNAVISGNSAKSGGAIYNTGNTVFNGSTTISGNIASAYGGAIYSSGNLVFSDNATLTGNTATSAYGGAIYAGKNVSFGDNANLSGNVAKSSHGGAIFAANDVFIGNNASVSGNKAAGHGGAIISLNGSVTFGNDAALIDNVAESASAYGGAVYAKNDVAFGHNTTVSNNRGSGYGGAIISMNGNVTFGDNTNLSNNEVSGSKAYGGTIYAAKDIVFGNNTHISNNRATTSGGAIYNYGDVTFNGSATITGNSATYGGAIYSFGTVVLNPDGSDRKIVFRDNVAGTSGASSAIYMSKDAKKIFLDYSNGGEVDLYDNIYGASDGNFDFEQSGNGVTRMWGTYNVITGSTTIRNGSFVLESAVTLPDTVTGQDKLYEAGHLVSYGTFLASENAVVDVKTGAALGAAELKLNGSTLNNTGTILANMFTAENSTIHVNQNALLNTDDIVINASSLTSSGTIDTGTLTIDGNGIVSLVDTGKLLTKSLDIRHGTLTAGGDSTLEFEPDASIKIGSNEHAGNLYAKNIKLNGASMFLDPIWSDDPALNTVDNASRVHIENIGSDGQTIDGKIIVGRNSLLVLGGDQEWANEEFKKAGSNWGPGAENVSAAIAIAKPVTLDAASGGIRVDGTITDPATSVNSNSISFGAGSLLVLNAKELDGQTAIVGDGTNSSINIDPTSKLLIANATIDSTVKVLDQIDTGSSTAWNGENVLMSTPMLDYTQNPDGSFGIVKGMDATDLYKKMSPSLSGIINDIYGSRINDNNHSNAGIRFFSRATDTTMISSTEEAANVMEGAAKLAAVGAVRGITLDINRSVQNALSSRLSDSTNLFDPARGSSTILNGDSSGQNITFWMTPLYQTEHTWNKNTGSYSTGYKGDFAGMIAGLETSASKNLRFGGAVNFGTGNADSRGDFRHTRNDFDFWGVNLYGKWKHDNLDLNAHLGYLQNRSELKQSLPSGMNMSELKSRVTAHSFTAGIEAAYKIKSDYIDVKPHIGLTYNRLSSNSYRIRSDDETIFNGKDRHQNIWSIPLGLQLSKTYRAVNNWNIKPVLDATVTYSTGDRDVHSQIEVPSLTQEADLTTDVVDKVMLGGNMGVEISRKDMAFGFKYQIQSSTNRTGQAVYAFFRKSF